MLVIGRLGKLGVQICEMSRPCVAVTAFPFALFLRSPMVRFPFLHHGHSFVRCSCRPAGEGCGRACSLFSRLLQSSLCHSQGHRGWRPVIDLSHLNCSVDVSHFHMENCQLMLHSLRPGEWMVFLDLKDSYLQVPVHSSSRRYLRFYVGDSVLQFRSLCFGLSTAP